MLLEMDKGKIEFPRIMYLSILVPLLKYKKQNKNYSDGVFSEFDLTNTVMKSKFSNWVF